MWKLGCTVLVTAFLVGIFSAAQETTTTSAPSTIVPMLMDLNNKTKSEVESILTDQNLSQQTMYAKLDAIFANQTEKKRAQYEATKAAFQEATDELEAQHALQIKNASAATQAADSIIRSIARNETLTTLQINRAILEVYFAQTPEVQTELNQYAIFKS
uniref:DUF148 domain-containing protein n=1 Tax=Panagrellus redivivus TaxID=6233 RepID=A0A7E4ZPT9_PANRE